MSGFSDLQGVTLVRIDRTDDRLVFIADDGRQWSMHHDQDCCESVSIDDVTGDLADLIGSTIIVADERASSDSQPGQDTESADSFTWTFYELRTVKSSVTIRWFGESNGYYSESVDFEEIGLLEPHDDETWIVAGDLALSRGQDDVASRYRAYFGLGGT